MRLNVFHSIPVRFDVFEVPGCDVTAHILHVFTVHKQQAC